MLLSLSIFFLLLIILFFLSRVFWQKFFLLVYLVCKNKEKSIDFISWFFLPGTIVHELSHLFTAEILRVKTGKISFLPEIIEEKNIQAGKVEVAKTDPLRHAIIGLAPTFSGLAIIYLLSHFLFSLYGKEFFKLKLWQYLLFFTGLYLVFTIINTMFASKKDLETILFPLLLFLLLTLIIYFSGVKVIISGKAEMLLLLFFKKMNFALLLSIVFNFFCFLFVDFLLKIKLKKQK